MSRVRSSRRSRLLRSANRAGRRLLAGAFSGGQEGTAVVEEAWDTLVILDACRLDTFAAENHLEGRLSVRRSLGATSSEFLKANFADSRYHDVVYVSANPYTSRLPAGTFHDLVPVYEEWDDERQTVTPETMNDAVVRAHERYPNKRIVAHYMQPHYPFLGEVGRGVDHRGYAPDGEYAAMDEYSIWTQLQFGVADASADSVIAAYRENLRLVLAALDELLPAISGKIVLTADHGNMLGERPWWSPVGIYGHYAGLHTPELVDVPWFELPTEVRRDVREEPPVGRTTEVDEGEVTDRLRALGYRE